MRINRGRLFIVSAPSGAGKTTLCKRLVSETPGLEFSVSYTTRKSRPGEVNNRDYTFVSEEGFREMALRGEFIEWAEVHGNLYGTSLGRLNEMLDKGINVMMDVDVQGAAQIREAFDDGIFIFILPPSRMVLQERLQNRKSDSGEAIKGRLKAAAEEIKDYSMYDYVIINDNLETALKQFEAVVVSMGLRTESMDHAWVEENFLRMEDA
jgi:guanylate kinase